MSLNAQKYIQKVAGNRFPAQELWINRNNEFWAFQKDNNSIFSTEGIFNGRDIIFETNNICNCHNIEECLDLLINRKKEEGYFCFASR